jgi:hypothetical protein
MCKLIELMGNNLIVSRLYSYIKKMNIINPFIHINCPIESNCPHRISIPETGPFKKILE